MPLFHFRIHMNATPSARSSAPCFSVLAAWLLSVRHTKVRSLYFASTVQYHPFCVTHPAAWVVPMALPNTVTVTSNNRTVVSHISAKHPNNANQRLHEVLCGLRRKRGFWGTRTHQPLFYTIPPASTSTSTVISVITHAVIGDIVVEHFHKRVIVRGFCWNRHLPKTSNIDILLENHIFYPSHSSRVHWSYTKSLHFCGNYSTHPFSVHVASFHINNAYYFCSRHNSAIRSVSAIRLNWYVIVRATCSARGQSIGSFDTSCASQCPSLPSAQRHLPLRIHIRYTSLSVHVTCTRYISL